MESAEWLFHPLFPGRIGIWKCCFLWREENRSTRRKILGAGTRTNNKLNPHMTPRPGIEPGPHWWEASALTTAPSLLPEWFIHMFSIISLFISVDVFVDDHAAFHLYAYIGKHLSNASCVTFSPRNNMFKAKRVLKVIFPAVPNKARTYYLDI